MARLYANENFPFPVVQRLRVAGHDVLTVGETGRAELAIADDEVLAFAAQNERILLRLNRKHFIRLHREGARHAGIIACTYDPDFAAQSVRIDHAIRHTSALQGELIRVNRPAVG